MGAGADALARGDPQAAFACYQSAARAEPGLAGAWYMQGGVYVMVGRGGEALRFFEHAVALQPLHAEAWFEMGNVLLSQGQPHLAERALVAAAHALRTAAEAGGGDGGGGGGGNGRGVVAGLPDEQLHATVLSNLGNALLEQGRGAEAEARYEEAVRVAPLCIAYNGLSNALEGQGKHGEASAACLRGARALPSCDLAYYNLGRLLRAAQSRQAEAAAAHKEAVRLVPDNALYLNAYGTALQSEDNKGAARAYRQALLLAPRWSAPYRNLGLHDYEEGNSDAALKLFGTVVRAAPGHRAHSPAPTAPRPPRAQPRAMHDACMTRARRCLAPCVALYA